MKLFGNILNAIADKNPISRKLSIKLFLIYIAVIAVPVIIYALLSYYLVSSKDDQDYIQYRSNMSLQLIKSLEDNMVRLKRQSSSVFINLDDISYVIKTPLEEIDDNYLEIKKRVNSYLYSIMDNNDSIDGITIIGANGDIVYYLSKANLNSTLVSVKNELWFKNTLTLKGSPYFIEPHQNRFILSYNSSDPHNYVISVSRAIQKPDDPNWNIGVIVFDQKISQLGGLLSDYQPSEGESIYFLGKDNQIIFTKGPKLPVIGKEAESAFKNGMDTSFRFVYNNVKHLANLSVSKDLGWKVVSVIPLKVLQSRNAFLKNSTTLLLLVLLIFIFLISIIVASLISKPLRRLKKSFKSLESGNFNIRVPVSGRDEMSDISNSFNSMVLNIKQLIEQKYEANILCKQAELESLQSQINPHFLFNTLNSIKSVSDRYGNDKASNMIQELSDLFRYSLNRGKHLVKFREEMENIKKYLSLQSIRFEDRFSVSIDIVEDVLELDTVRLTLQPIVENSIFHGLETSLHKGLISISAIAAGGKFIIYVSDNGIGIPAEQLREMNSLLETNPESLLKAHPEKLGIYNVNSRIKLHFGNEYGLSIYSVPDSNTTVKITLPAKN